MLHRSTKKKPSEDGLEKWRMRRKFVWILTEIEREITFVQ
jgi:hypothetical protein